MTDLNETELNALAKAAGLTIPAELMAEVGDSLNDLLEALDHIDVPGLDKVEPFPMMMPTDPESRSTRP